MKLKESTIRDFAKTLDDDSIYEMEIGEARQEKALQDDVEQGLIASYTIGDDFIVYRQKGGRKEFIDLSKYDVE